MMAVTEGSGISVLVGIGVEKLLSTIQETLVVNGQWWD